MGYSISLAISVNRLMNDKIQTVRVIYFKGYSFGLIGAKALPDPIFLRFLALHLVKVKLLQDSNWNSKKRDSLT